MKFIIFVVDSVQFQSLIHRKENGKAHAATTHEGMVMRVCHFPYVYIYAYASASAAADIDLGIYRWKTLGSLRYLSHLSFTEQTKASNAELKLRQPSMCLRHQ